MDSLETLREEIRRVDEAIAELVARRQMLVRRVGEEKERLGLPIRDFAAERRILDAMNSHASRLDLDREILEGIALQLIRGSVSLQTRDRNRRLPPATGGGTAAVIGGAGHMGRWFSGFLASRGYDVRIIESGDPSDDAIDADLIVVAVPLEVVPRIVEKLAGDRVRGTVMEISSLKSPLVDRAPAWIAGGMRYVSIHPMFGAEADMLSGQNLIICSAGCPQAEGEAAALFADSAVHVVRIPLADHDRYMMWVLNMPHLINLIAADLLASSTESNDRLRELGGTTFNRQRVVAAEVASENPDLYFSIQRVNRHRGELFDAIRTSLERIAGDVEAGRRNSFVDRMLRWRAWFQMEGS